MINSLVAAVAVTLAALGSIYAGGALGAADAPLAVVYAVMALVGLVCGVGAVVGSAIIDHQDSPKVRRRARMARNAR